MGLEQGGVTALIGLWHDVVAVVLGIEGLEQDESVEKVCAFEEAEAEMVENACFFIAGSCSTNQNGLSASSTSKCLHLHSTD